MNYLNKINLKYLLKSGKHRVKYPCVTLARSSSSTFLYLVQKRLFKEALLSKLCQSLTNHQGVNTLGNNGFDIRPLKINNSEMNCLNKKEIIIQLVI